MKITISARAAVLDSDDHKVEVTAPDALRRVDGLSCEQGVCADYLHQKLADLGIIGGRVWLSYLPGANGVRVLTDYWAPRALDKDEIDSLVEETLGQWSDGLGGGWADGLDLPELYVDLCPSNQGDTLRVEQVEDGQPVPPASSLPRLAREGNVEGLRGALAAGENANVRQQGYTPLLLAITYQRPEAAVLLVEHGADVGAATNEGTPPLVQAALILADADAVLVARALLERGAAVDAPDEGGRTALMFARRRGKEALAALLVEHGADDARHI